MPQGIAYITQQVPEIIEDASNALPGSFRLLLNRLLDAERNPPPQGRRSDIESLIPPYMGSIRVAVVCFAAHRFTSASR